MTIFSPIKLSTKAILIGQYMERETGKISPSLAGIGWTIKQAGIGLQNLGFDEVETNSVDFNSSQQHGDPLTGLQDIQFDPGDDSNHAGSVVDALRGLRNHYPEILDPLNLYPLMTADTYQYQDDSSSYFMGGEQNQGMNSYQAREERSTVMA